MLKLAEDCERLANTIETTAGMFPLGRRVSISQTG